LTVIGPLLAFVPLLLVGAILGATIGLITGVILALVFQGELRTLWRDALWGSIGLITGFLASSLIPTHRESLAQNIHGHAGALRFQHPYWIAFLVAIFLPAFLRMRRARLALKRAE
jgi:hypothetical protein